MKSYATISLRPAQWRKEGHVLFNDGYMVKDQSTREETRHRHYMGYSFRLTARVLLYASFHRQNNTYHGLCYTSRGALAGTRNSSMGQPRPAESNYRHYCRGVNLYGLRVSLTDFCDLHGLTGIRCNPYGFLQIQTYNHSTLYIRTVVSLQ